MYHIGFLLIIQIDCLVLFILTHIKWFMHTVPNKITRTHTQTDRCIHTFCPIFKHHAGIVIQCSKKLDPYTLLPQGVVTRVIFECAMRLSTTRPQDTQDKTFMGLGLLQTYTHKHTEVFIGPQLQCCTPAVSHFKTSWALLVFTTVWASAEAKRCPAGGLLQTSTLFYFIFIFLRY